MRILHIGVNAKTESMPRYFRAVADVYDEMLPEEAEDNGKDYDVCFIQIQNDKIGNELTVNKLAWVKRLKDNGCCVQNWSGDKRSVTPQWMVQFAPNVTYTCFSNMQDVNRFHALGLPSYFLQIGIDEQIFKPRDLEKDIDVVFMGNHYGNQFPLSRFRYDLVMALKRDLGDRFKLYGNGWNNADGNLNGNQIEESKIYNRAKIAISASHFNSDRYTSDRLLRIMASDVCPLVHRFNGLERDFDEGKDFITFNTIQECKDKIQMMLIHKDWRNEIRANALEKSKSFTYKTMVNNVVKM